MSLYPNHYPLYDNFGKNGGHVRRKILLEIKKEQTQADNELQELRMNLAECSYMADPLKWNMLLDNVNKAANKLHDITRELKKLEDIHVSVNHGVLPY